MCFWLSTTVCSWLYKVSCTKCTPFGAKVWFGKCLSAVIHFARYMRCFALWVYRMLYNYVYICFKYLNLYSSGLWETASDLPVCISHTNPLSSVCVQMTRLYTLEMRAIDTRKSDFACIWYANHSHWDLRPSFAWLKRVGCTHRRLTIKMTLT